jgi:hypothetical protein
MIKITAMQSLKVNSDSLKVKIENDSDPIKAPIGATLGFGDESRIIPQYFITLRESTVLDSGELTLKLVPNHHALIQVNDISYLKS